MTDIPQDADLRLRCLHVITSGRPHLPAVELVSEASVLMSFVAPVDKTEPEAAGGFVDTAFIPPTVTIDKSKRADA